MYIINVYIAMYIMKYKQNISELFNEWDKQIENPHCSSIILKNYLYTQEVCMTHFWDHKCDDHIQKVVAKGRIVI